ncbi:ABC transporter permease [Niveibacterium sp. 24ML]|uniref:ABC transporter permease n=1 Tax=Niveibacterium sp. 24ML TaxID=2985512 RepID=UPI002271AE1A|nr:ABC transporter permease [Niveibacterium sp. 24ML]MCX9155054.1 ABC transporter permease [Niveibacterium sp. 24ML]
MFIAALRRSLRRELAHLARDRWDRALLLWLPLISFLLIAGIFAAGQIRDLPIGLLDADRSPLSRQLARLIDAAPGVRIVTAPSDHQAATHAIQARTIYGVVEIPAGFERKLKRAQGADVLFFYNAQFATAAGIVAKDVQAATLTFGAGIRVVAREKRGESPLAVSESAQPISLSLVSLYNESIDYRAFLGAALLPSVLQIFIMVVGVSVVGREIRDRTLPDWLAVADGQPLAALLGKLLPAFAVFAIWGLAFLIAWGGLQSAVPWGAHAMLALGMLTMVAAYLLLGAMIAALTANLRTALSVVGFYTAPAFAYVGQAFPLMAMPLAAKAWAAILPLTWWLQLQSQQWQMGTPLHESAPALGILLLMLMLGTVGAAIALKRVAGQAQRWGAR